MLEYQDALWPGETVAGERSSGERWDMIAPVLPEQGVLLDVGSNLGFYGINALRVRPRLALVSLEADAEIAAKQARIAAANRMGRAVVLEGSLDAVGAELWAETCDMVDCTLLLSIVHWFDEPERVLAALSRLSRMLVVELPDAGDTGACGRSKLALWGPDPEGWLRSVTGRDVRLLGRPARHTSAVNSWMCVVDGPVERTPRRPYVGSDYSHPRGRDYRLSADGDGTRLWVRGVERPWIPGVNVANLAALGRCRYPEPATLRRCWAVARAAAPGHLDPAPHNLLWGAQGMALIDGDDLDGRITDPDREMRRFIRGWVGTGGYDDRLLRRIGDERRRRTLRRLARWAPGPVKRAVKKGLRLCGSRPRRRDRC